MYAGFQPDDDATAVALMRAEGGVVVGTAQMGSLAVHGGRLDPAVRRHPADMQ
ncbi:MAG: hypothetical protein ABW328_20715 [Ilumatobacteraceae bacterium]